MILSNSITRGNLAPTTKTMIKATGIVQTFLREVGGLIIVSEAISMACIIIHPRPIKMEKEYVGWTGNIGALLRNQR